MENEVLISRKSDELERINSLISGLLSQGQRGSHTIHCVWETLEVREFCVNSHRRFFFSSTSCSVLWPVKCTSPSSGALVPTETKARIFGCFFFGCTGCLFPVWPFLYFRQVGATLCLQGAWLLVAMVSFVMSTSSRHTHFSSFATQAQYLSFSLVAPWHVRSSQNKDRTHVSRIGKLTFYHAATRMLGKLKK